MPDLIVRNAIDSFINVIPFPNEAHVRDRIGRFYNAPQAYGVCEAGIYHAQNLANARADVLIIRNVAPHIAIEIKFSNHAAAQVNQGDINLLTNAANNDLGRLLTLNAAHFARFVVVATTGAGARDLILGVTNGFNPAWNPGQGLAIFGIRGRHDGHQWETYAARAGIPNAAAGNNYIYYVRV